MRHRPRVINEWSGQVYNASASIVEPVPGQDRPVRVQPCTTLEVGTAGLHGVKSGAVERVPCCPIETANADGMRKSSDTQSITTTVCACACVVNSFYPVSFSSPATLRLPFTTLAVPNQPTCMGRLIRDGQCCGREAQCSRGTKETGQKLLTTHTHAVVVMDWAVSLLIAEWSVMIAPPPPTANNNNKNNIASSTDVSDVQCPIVYRLKLFRMCRVCFCQRTGATVTLLIPFYTRRRKTIKIQR